MEKRLIEAARAARAAAYAPYSDFAVGAAVAASSGAIYAGCNVENASYGLTVCAERVAVFNAVSAGEREITAVAVVSGPGAPPCGACRQVLAEFAPRAGEMTVIVVSGQGDTRRYTLGELLPVRFSGEAFGTL